MTEKITIPMPGTLGGAKLVFKKESIDKKILVTSGCSYTAIGHEGLSWPGYLSTAIGCDHINYACISAGNRYISSSLIYGISEALKTYEPKDIIVGVIWSGNSRGSLFKSNINTRDITCLWESHNPIGFIDKNWIITNHHWDDRTTKNYYTTHDDDTEFEIQTLEHILRVQWFLESKKVDYFMSTYAPGVLPTAPNANTQHLLDLVNWNKFLDVENYITWCINSGIPLSEDDQKLPITFMHPTKEHHKAFVNQVIVPFIGEPKVD